MAVIRFYSPREANGWLSNFSPHPVEVDGLTWPTVEHYFQAAKVDGDEGWRRRIRHAPTPAGAKQLGRRAPLRPDWHEVREAIMLRGLRAKFSQHPDLADRLLATGAAELVEHTDRDSFWADGGDGSGRNALGHLLATVRAELAVT